MTRHARNCTAGAVYTYHEKQKDTQTCGYGTQKMRLGKDAVKDFDCCCLSLQPCRNPVITPDGFLFDKEAILEYIIRRKAENARLLKEYEAQKRRDEVIHSSEPYMQTTIYEQEKLPNHLLQLQASVIAVVMSEFRGSSALTAMNCFNVWENKMGLTKQIMSSTSVGCRSARDATVVICNYFQWLSKEFPARAFVIFANTTTFAGKTDILRFILQARFMCAVTHDILGNSVPCAALKTSGNVVTMECVEKLLKKDWLDPTNGKTLTEADIIPLQRGGTGYASTNVQLDAKVKKPVMTV
ncbi:unnamed protein product [Ixodes persulcatus]